MRTLVLERGDSSYLINTAHIARSRDDVSADLAASVAGDWEIDKSSPFLTWIAGDFVEGDNPNSNKQFFTAGDLELAEYSIKYAPLNMVHKFRTPVGFFAATKNVKLERALRSVDSASDTAAAQGSMKIQALSGMWSHIFPFESALVENANDEGLLFYSMESRAKQLTCAGDAGCGETFDYMQPDTHCAHLQERSSIRHLVEPTFRGGALIIPPTNPGWKEARASVITEAVMQEAAAFAEQNEAAYRSLEADGVTITASGWEQLMGMLIATTRAPAH